MSSIRILLAVCILSSVATKAVAETKEWSWTHLNFALCPGFGVAGTFTVKLRAEFDTTAQAHILRSADVIPDSPSFQNGTPSASASLSAGSNVVGLRKPWYPTIGPPGLVFLVMPPNNPSNPNDRKQKPMTVPIATPLKLKVSPVVTSSSGSCSLGTLEATVDF